MAFLEATYQTLAFGHQDLEDHVWTIQGVPCSILAMILIVQEHSTYNALIAYCLIVKIVYSSLHRKPYITDMYSVLRT